MGASGAGSVVGAAGAEEQLNVFALAMTTGVTAKELASAIFANPSYASDVGSMVG